MRLSEFYAKVSRHADTCGQQIDVADVSRVLATAFEVLKHMEPAELLKVLALGLGKERPAPKPVRKRKGR